LVKLSPNASLVSTFLLANLWKYIHSAGIPLCNQREEVSRRLLIPVQLQLNKVEDPFNSLPGLLQTKLLKSRRRNLLYKIFFIFFKQPLGSPPLCSWPSESPLHLSYQCNGYRMLSNHRFGPIFPYIVMILLTCYF
ncbi:hypothetical protein CHARACLAT_012991, partial [Characodon lateralis]|nr:hypothetical protein [Characodon lateralis]